MTSLSYTRGGVRVIGQMNNSDGTFESANRVYDTEGVAPTVVTCSGGGLQPKIIDKPKQLGFYDSGIEMVDGEVADVSYPNSEFRRGRVENEGNVSPTLTTTSGVRRIQKNMNQFAIRKLTAKECFRLMGMSDGDYDKAAEVVSETRRYHAAGDSIVVPVLMAIFSQLNIQGMPMWNDITDEERYALIGWYE